jgi:glucose/arabinose dehydrogenase
MFALARFQLKGMRVSSRARRALTLSVAALLCLPYAARAQLRATVYVTGLSLPLEFVQHPADPATQYVVEQAGRIRVISSGVLQAASFLDLSTQISSGGERGLLGLALPSDFATSRRFYVNFTDTNGNTVVARFSAPSNTQADPTSRFDLLWSTGQRYIVQPFANHNGGHLAFGPDGYLYIGMGDGGSGNDPNNYAQTPSSLLGKMLRIDVGVPNTDAKGFRIPSANPFSGSAGLPEIWDFGIRNPWKFSFDDPVRGGTGALIIADVGQNAWEEIDYEPRNRGGRNYGWRVREGLHDNVTTLPPAFTPLTNPIFEYSHSIGSSVTGGYVYRGSVGAPYRGRYVFADFVSGRVWSLALGIDPISGEAQASDFIEHTAEMGGDGAVGNVSSLGVDAGGELYVVSYSLGQIFKLLPTPVPPPVPSGLRILPP